MDHHILLNICDYSMNETKDNSGSAEAGNTYIPLFMWDFVEDWEKSIVLLGSEVEGLLVGI